MTEQEQLLMETLKEENEKLKNQLKFHACKDIGEEYQDFICDELLKIGIPLNVYVSKKYQLGKGESASGIEIKHDSKYSQTGKLYFEVEAMNKQGSQMINGGITKEDKSWLYLIGDESRAFIFSKKQLIRLYEKVKENPLKWKDKYGISIHQHIDADIMKATSSGMCIPIKELDRIGICIKELVFKGDTK